MQFFLRILGLKPHDFNTKTFEIQDSNFNTIWAIIFNIIIIYYYLQSINLYMDLLEDTFRQSFISAISTKYAFYSNIIVFTLIYIFQNIFKYKFRIIVTKFQRFIKITPTEPTLNYKHDVIIFIVKAILSKVCLIFAAFLNVQQNIGTYFNAIMIVIPIIVIYTISSCFYGINVAVKYYFKSINMKIETIVSTIKMTKSQKSTSYEKIKIHCELSDQIDEIAKMHGELCDMVKEFMQLYQIQVLLTFVNILSSLLAQLFHCFLAFTGYVRYTETTMLDSRFSAVLYIIVGSSDILMQINACRACSREVNMIFKFKYFLRFSNWTFIVECRLLNRHSQHANQLRCGASNQTH